MTTQEVWIDSTRPRLRVSLDGEVTLVVPPLHYQIRPRALAVLRAEGRRRAAAA